MGMDFKLFLTAQAPLAAGRGRAPLLRDRLCAVDAAAAAFSVRPPPYMRGAGVGLELFVDRLGDVSLIGHLF